MKQETLQGGKLC